MLFLARVYIPVELWSSYFFLTEYYDYWKITFVNRMDYVFAKQPSSEGSVIHCLLKTVPMKHINAVIFIVTSILKRNDW